MKTLTITEASASAIVRLAEQIVDSGIFDSVEATVTVPSAPSVAVTVPSAPSIPTFEVPSNVVLEPSAPAVATTSKPSAWKLEKAAKSAKNKSINASINARLANATKASDIGDVTQVLASLREAMELVPTHLDKQGNLAWKGTVERIVAKAQSLGLATA